MVPYWHTGKSIRSRSFYDRFVPLINLIFTTKLFCDVYNVRVRTMFFHDVINAVFIIFTRWIDWFAHSLFINWRVHFHSQILDSQNKTTQTQNNGWYVVEVSQKIMVVVRQTNQLKLRIKVTSIGRTSSFVMGQK